MLQFEVNASVLKTTSFIFSLTPDTASLRTAIENLEASRSSPKCFFTGTKFSALTHAYSRNQQFLAFCIKVNIFLFESILYFTIDAVVNVEAYHRMIIIFRVAECSWPWARLQGGQRKYGIHWLQVRRQDFPAGSQKSQGETHFFINILDVCSNRKAKHEMGGTYFKWGNGHHCPGPGWLQLLNLLHGFLPTWGKCSIRSKALNNTACYSSSAHFWLQLQWSP